MPSGVYIRIREVSKETREKMSKKSKGNKHALGYRHTKEAKRKISEAGRGNKYGLDKHHKPSKETKRKMSKAAKGRKFSIETRGKMSETLKKKWGSDKEYRQKMSETHTGERHSNWKGGISFEPYTTDWTKTLRRSIRERDKYICQLCNEPQGDKTHCIHHIDYDKKNCNPDNLITLCRGCNGKVNFNREYWTVFFQGRNR